MVIVNLLRDLLIDREVDSKDSLRAHDGVKGQMITRIIDFHWSLKIDSFKSKLGIDCF
jgi:hypothetical protein